MALASHTRAALGLKPMLKHGKNEALEKAKKRKTEHFRNNLKASRASKSYYIKKGGVHSGRLTPKEVYRSKNGNEYDA